MGVMTLYIIMSCWGPILAKHISFTATLKNMARCQIGDQSFQSKYRQDTAPAYRSSPSKHDTYGEANFGKVKWPKNKRKLILHPRCLRCYVAKFREECGSWKGERPWVTHYTSKHIWIQRSESIKKQFFKHHCRHLTLPRSFLVQICSRHLGETLPFSLSWSEWLFPDEMPSYCQLTVSDFALKHNVVHDGQILLK